jgi:hypothetical protein
MYAHCHVSIEMRNYVCYSRWSVQLIDSVEDASKEAADVQDRETAENMLPLRLDQGIINIVG